MKKPTLRRVCAYIVDLIVITIISSMFVRIEFLNPKYDEYQNPLAGAEFTLEKLIDDKYEKVQLFLNFTVFI